MIYFIKFAFFDIFSQKAIHWVPWQLKHEHIHAYSETANILYMLKTSQYQGRLAPTKNKQILVGWTDDCIKICYINKIVNFIQLIKILMLLFRPYYLHFQIQRQLFWNLVWWFSKRLSYSPFIPPARDFFEYIIFLAYKNH